MPGSTGKASSQASTITEQEQHRKKLEKLTIQMHSMTCERDELCGILARYTDKDLNNRLNFELAILNMEHQKVMLALQKLPKELREAWDKYKELAQETESCCRLLIEWTKLKHAVKSLRRENRKLQREQVLLQKSWEETKRLCEEAHEKICGPWAKQQQDQDGLEKRPQDPTKQKELVTQQKDLAEKMQHQLGVSEMSSEIRQYGPEEASAQDESSLQLLLQEH
ncbi:disks large homolog 5-like [Acomys russatus]|uniref:disks large homolog 5-like n=1 Tax=Acomys russatus TaxID=60746 RepID=UPI0021E27881|nr:disks large homolog 5-like [Acomys russatus]